MKKNKTKRYKNKHSRKAESTLQEASYQHGYLAGLLEAIAVLEEEVSSLQDGRDSKRREDSSAELPPPSPPMLDIRI